MVETASLSQILAALWLVSLNSNYRMESGLDPVVGAAIAKAAGASREEAERDTGRLLSRVLGPSADELGEALRRYTELRRRNVGRIIQSADRKQSKDGAEGEVPPRVAHRLLDEGSHCDDELMAEYLGGVLAASRTPSGRDDRGAAWTALVASMSTLQIRAHFLLYREWAAVLRGRDDIQLGGPDASRATRMHIDLATFLRAVTKDDDVPLLEALSHSIQGLRRLDLLGNNYGWGKSGAMAESGFSGPFESSLNVTFSQPGLELYGWAQGLTGLSHQDFTSRAEVFAEAEVPRLLQVVFPDLFAPPPL